MILSDARGIGGQDHQVVSRRILSYLEPWRRELECRKRVVFSESEETVDLMRQWHTTPNGQDQLPGRLKVL